MSESLSFNPAEIQEAVRRLQALHPEAFAALFGNQDGHESLKLNVNIAFTLRDARGRFKARRVFHNLICTAGKNLILASGGTSKYVKDYAYVCIGTGTTAANAADTALQTEVARALGTVSNPTSSTLKVTYTFPAGTGTGAITESALDNANSASAAILARQVFSAVNKGASDTLQVDWTIS